MSEIKTIFFDLDDTLLDFGRSEDAAIRSTLRAFGRVPSDADAARYSEINRSMWKLFERGEKSRAQIRTERFGNLFSELKINANAEKARDVYENELAKTAFFLPEAEELLSELHGKYALFIASNGTAPVQKSRIAISGIGKYFDGIFISDSIGYNKPSREFFDYCFMQIKDFDRARAIIVGDSLSSDIAGGINAGIRTCLFNPEKKPLPTAPIPDYEIKSLMELPLILKGI